jgi:hypothetical protein
VPVRCLTRVSTHPEQLRDVLVADSRVIVVARWGATDRVAFNVFLRGLAQVRHVDGWMIASVPRRWSARAAG